MNLKMNPIIQLRDGFLRAASDNNLPYVIGRLDQDDKYTGWVNPALKSSNPTLSLDLNRDNERFLLFCLASAWSASGQWENAATLVYTIKHDLYELTFPNAWVQESATEKLRSLTQVATTRNSSLFNPRKKIHIREDVFPAFRNIALKWVQINEQMRAASQTADWENFIYQLRDIEGLAPGFTSKGHGKALLIKIPLILRELRCQNIFQNIPGELCCVPDQRVIDAVKALQKQPGYPHRCRLKSYRPSTPQLLIASSKAIYEHFGDLYDLPLFALADIPAILQN